MNFFRVGIIDFFGILCPGVLLVVNINVFLFACNINLWASLEQVSMGDNGLILFLFLFVLCYLFGFILRLISPDIIDKITTILFRIIFLFRYIEKNRLKKSFISRNNKGGLNRREKKEQFRKYLDSYYNKLIQRGKKLPKYFWIDEIYPYYYSLKSIYRKHMTPKISHSIISKKSLHNKTVYNFWKTTIADSNPTLSTLIFQAEAFVRFMAGSFWSLLVGIISGLILIINQSHDNNYFSYGLILSTVSIILAYIILSRFKNQRRREVMILLNSIFTITNKN